MIIDRNHSRSRSIPLQWLILLAFVVQIFGAVGLVAYLSYRSGEESANKLALRLKTEISTRVTEKTTTYLQAIDQVNKNNIIEEISGFLRTIDIQAGTVFIMERDQTLVATSSLTQNPNQPLQNTKDQKLLKAIDSPNLQISGTAKYLRDRNVNLANIRQAEQFELEINGDRQLVQVTPLRDRNGLDWIIVVVLPESDFMADIQANKVWTILFCGITLLITTGISIITTRWITKPILRLSQASKAIASGEWQEPLNEDGHITELNFLSASFNQMAGKLRQSLDQKSTALQEKEYWFNRLVEIIPDPIFLKDGEGQYLIINRQGLKLFDLSDTNYFGKTDAELAELNPFYHDSLLYCAATDEIAWSKKELSRTEELIPQADGSQIIFDVVRVPLFTKSGDRKGLVVIARDISDRKQAEIILERTVNELNYHIKNSPLATIRWDREFRVEYWSKQAEEIFGWSAEEVLGKKLHEWRFVFEDDLEYVFQHTSKMLDGVSGLIGQNRNYHKDGSIIYCEWHNSTLVDESGNLISMFSLAHNVSDRKQAEIDLQTSKMKLNDILNSATASIARLLVKADGSFKVDYISDGCEAVSGYKKTEFLSEPSLWNSRTNPDDWQAIEAHLYKNIFAERSAIYIYRFQHKDGSWRWISQTNSSRWDAIQNAWVVTIISSDISDRKQAEIALKQSEQTNRAILNAIPDLLIRVDRDGSCLDFIPPLSEQAGIFLPVVKHISEVLPQDLLNLQLQRIAQALATGELQVWENQIIKNDQICYEEIRVFPCGTDECLVIVRDISARKQTELALIEAKIAAEAATKAKSDFLASMSHEIRTPMNGVIGMTQILGMTELTADQQEFVKTIKDSGEALLTIINDILDFSKIESGMLEIESKDFDLEEVIRGVCNLLENQTITKQIDLKYAIAPDIPKTMIGDLARLRQILLNLVGNAVKFTQHGHVSIGVSGKKVRGKYELTFAIADTGIGIASDRLDLLFQAFTQADNSISREYGGTGLGLAISKRLVNLMEGTIWVESLGQVGGNPPIAWQPQPHNPLTPQGSTFYFTITLLINQTINQSQTVLEKEFKIDEKFAEKFPLRILLVEDNPVNQMVAKLMLQRLGYQLNAIANNGLEAVQAVQNYDYDLILMDVQMPKMDGLTATKMIRTGLKSHVRIVAMTADAMPEDRQACLNAGMDDFISKPVSIQALMSIASSTK
jgi:PAS domain S-box-containing protein